MWRPFCLAILITAGGCKCTDDPVFPNDAGADSARTDMGSDTALEDAEMGQPNAPRRAIFITSGGGHTSSANVDAKISIGAPQPVGTASSSQTTIQMGPSSGLAR